MFHKATKKKCKLRLAICAPSGAGKTYGALRLATGLGGRIAVIDTENSSAELYSDKFDYDVCCVEAPFTPEKYIRAIKEAEKQGYETIIIDSLSHAWAGTGGILDMHENYAKASKNGNTYTAWRNVTPHHNALVDAMLQSKCHVIATMRSKTAYEVTKDSNGKTMPVKIGLSPVQREGMDYEFTVVLDISPSGHMATASKDRTGLLDEQCFQITESVGESLMNWLNQGSEEDHKIEYFVNHFDLDGFVDKIQSAPSMEELKSEFEEAKASIKALDASQQAKKAAMETVTVAKDKRKLHLQKETKAEPVMLQKLDLDLGAMVSQIVTTPMAMEGTHNAYV